MLLKRETVHFFMSLYYRLKKNSKKTFLFFIAYIAFLSGGTVCTMLFFDWMRCWILKPPEQTAKKDISALKLISLRTYRCTGAFSQNYNFFQSLVT